MSRCCRKNESVPVALDIRQLDVSELTRVREIDRSEHIDLLYAQDGERLIERKGSWESRPWDPEGEGEHSVSARVRELDGYEIGRAHV